MDMHMTLRPRLSEKAYGLSQTRNVYVFEVPTDVGKLAIAQAVTAQFNVHVVNVNITNVKGKVKRSVRKGGRSVFGKRTDIKKAYVTLKAGDSIAVFASEEETEKEAAKATKKGKK